MKILKSKWMAAAGVLAAFTPGRGGQQQLFTPTQYPLTLLVKQRNWIPSRPCASSDHRACPS
jgi:hypothetical protein